MPWFTVDVGLVEHSKMAELPSDTARYGWFVTLSKAKIQGKPGTFGSDRHFRFVLGRFGKFLPDYVKARLLEENQDGSLAVHDWRQYQWKVSKERQREDGGETPSGQNDDSRAHNVVPVSVLDLSSGEKGSGEEGADALVAYHSLTGRFPTGRVKTWLLEMGTDFGEEAVSRALAAELIADPAVQTLLSRTENHLALEQHEAEKRRAAVRAKAAEDERQLIDTMPPERRAENLARLGDLMAEKGLLPKRPITAMLDKGEVK